jgi:hypothetical protein
MRIFETYKKNWSHRSWHFHDWSRSREKFASQESDWCTRRLFDWSLSTISSFDLRRMSVRIASSSRRRSWSNCNNKIYVWSMIILRRYQCKFSRQKHICSSFNCTWHVCRYSLNNAWKSTNTTCWLKIFVDKLNIVYSKRENVVVEEEKKRRQRENVVVEEQKKRRQRERSNKRKRCTLNCLQTKKRTSFFWTEFSSSSFWENEETCEAHIKQEIDAESARRWWRISRQREWNCTKIWSNRKFFSLFTWKQNV